MTTLQIQLNDDLKKQLEDYSRESGMSLGEAAKELLQRQADLQKMASLRQKARPYAKQAGINSEEEAQAVVKKAVDEYRDDA